MHIAHNYIKTEQKVLSQNNIHADCDCKDQAFLATQTHWDIGT